MRTELVIWGAGGHAKVVLDTARAMGYERIHLFDDAAQNGDTLLGCSVTKPVDEIGCDAEFIVAIGNNHMRARCFSRGLELGWKPATLIHPSAIVSPHSMIDRGSVVLPKAVVNAGAVVGQNCIINTGSVIEHDCHISDHVHISPCAALAGNVCVESYAHIGLGSSLLVGASVGEQAIVGAGAVVLKSVPSKTTVVGVPARVLHQASKSNCKQNEGRNSKRILLSVPHMGGFEQDFVNEAFASNWLSTVGPNITEFEREFEEKLGVSAVAVGSGTAALHLGLRALGVGPSDTVFCSDLTFVASANPIRYLGAEPVFIDSDRKTWNMDPQVLSDALSVAARNNRLPKAVLVVHLFGQCADMDPILESCSRYCVPVLEDAAEALGAFYKGRPAGTLGHLGAFSFNGNKIITTTGGGMLVSNDSEIINKVRFWATQARDAGLSYNHSELGYNYRLSNVLAGIGRGQLRVLDQRVKQRRAVASRYFDGFADLPGITPMPQAAYGLHTNWLSCFLIDEIAFGCSRDELIGRLDAANIETRPLWKPMHLQALYATAECHGGHVAQDLFERGICFPSSSSLTLEDQAYVIAKIREAAARHSAFRVPNALDTIEVY